MRKSKADIICDKFHEKHKNDPKYQEDAEKYVLDKLESEESNLWIKEHDKVCKLRKRELRLMKEGHSPAGGWGRYSIEVTPTSIGNIYKIKCACGKSHDVTHVETW